MKAFKTRVQRERLAAIADYIEEHGYSPSLRDLAACWGVSSPSVVSYNLDKMRHAGLVEFSDDHRRTLRLTPKGVSIIGVAAEPAYGTVEPGAETTSGHP